MLKTSCTTIFGGGAITRVLGAAALIVGLGFSQQALAVQASGAVSLLPSDNGLIPTQVVSVIVRVTNASSETGDEGGAAVVAELSGAITVTLACTTPGCAVEIPDTLDFVAGAAGGCLARAASTITCAASGENQVIVAINGTLPLPAGAAIDVAVIQLRAKNAVQSPVSGAFSQRAETGDNDITAESAANDALLPVTGGAQGSTNYTFPGICDVRVDKQLSCDGGATWIDDNGLQNDNGDGTDACQGLSTDLIQVRYRVSNAGSLDAGECVLGESNAAFGNPSDPGTIAAGSTSNYIPGVNSPVCSSASGAEPNTATVTCNLCNGVTPPDPAGLTAFDSATFSCVTVDLQVDRAVSCVNGDPAGYNDEELVKANEDGTDGPTTLDGDSCSWKYQSKNNGTATLYNCELVDLNALVSPNPIPVGTLIAGQLVDTPATNSVDCSAALETAEAPNGGRVDLRCCATNTALVSCDETKLVAVFDVSTVTCQTPNLDVVKDCAVNSDNNNATFTITATNTGEVALENCVATDSLSPDGLCPNTANPLEQVLDPAAPFVLAAGANQVLTGGATLTSDACNNVSVTCDVPGNGPITRTASDDCPYTPEQEGCLTRTPGFWGTHPAITDNFLDIGVCGTTINNVTAGNGNSAIEAMCSVGNDGKILGSQLTQLVRQCTAATLNVAASRVLEGNCDADYPGIDALLEGCCGSQSVCTGDAVAGLSVNECIGRLDAFNNTPADTLNFPYKTGPADSSVCRDSKNNGVVVRPTP